MVQLGELSAGRQALEAAPIAPGNMRTLSALTDIERRPPRPRAPIPADILNHEPELALELDQDLFLKSLKSARKGAAGGPSGMTVEHLRPLLENQRDAERFWMMGQELANASVPDEIIQALRVGRLTPLLKPSGGVGGWRSHMGQLVKTSRNARIRHT